MVDVTLHKKSKKGIMKTNISLLGIITVVVPQSSRRGGRHKCKEVRGELAIHEL